MLLLVSTQAEETRDIDYATTVSYDKKARKWDEEDILTRRADKEAYQNLTKEVYA